MSPEESDCWIWSEHQKLFILKSMELGAVDYRS